MGRIWEHVVQTRYESKKPTNRQSHPQSLKRGKEKAPSVMCLLSGWITASARILRDIWEGDGASSNILLERNLSISKCGCWELDDRGSHQDGIQGQKDKDEKAKPYSRESALQCPEVREKGYMSAIKQIVLSPSWLRVLIASLTVRS